MVIYNLKCDSCDFHVDTGTGQVMYVTDDGGKRIVCPHPLEFRTVRKVLGEHAGDERLLEERTGFLQMWVCLDCLSRHRLDLERDEHKCDQCGSMRGSSAIEMIDKICPKCKQGKIRLEKTGMVT